MVRRARALDFRLGLAGEKLAAWEELDRERCRRSFISWLKDWGWMQAPKSTGATGRRQVPFQPWPSQVETAGWIQERREAGDEALILKSREIGLSWLVLHYCLWCWIFEDGFSALLGSRKQETVDRKGDMTALFPKLRWLLKRQPAHIRPREVSDKLLVLENHERHSEITGESANPEFGAAGRKSVVFIDEAARVPSRILRHIWTATESVGGLRLLVFTAAPSKAHFVNELLGRLDARRVRILTWRADPSRDETWRRSRIVPEGGLSPEEFDESYDCKSGATATGNAFRIRRETLIYHEKSEGFDPEIRKTAPLITGCDWGTGPKSLAAIGAMIEWGPRPRILIDFACGWPGKTDFALTALPELAAEHGRYGRAGLVTGDPAGKQTERDGRSYVADVQAYGGFAWVPLQPVIEPGQDPLRINSTAWKRWAVKLCQRMMDDGTLLVHERCEDVLIWALERWSWNVPEGATVEDIRGAGELLKDLPSHACEAMLYAVTFCLATIEAERARAAAREPEDDEGDGPDMFDMLANR